jgi:hypothetical protein
MIMHRKVLRVGRYELPARALCRGHRERLVRGSLATRDIPIRALALGADLWVLTLLAREPLVPASVAPIPGQLHLRHYSIVAYSQYIPNRLTVGPLPCSIYLVSIYRRVGQWKHGSNAVWKSRPPRSSAKRASFGSCLPLRAPAATSLSRTRMDRQPALARLRTV